MVVFDATMLLLILDEQAKPPRDSYYGMPVSKCQDRLKNLLSTLDEQGIKAVVPTPALSEVLVYAGDAAPTYVDFLRRSACFKIVSFDLRAAIELAAMTHEALQNGDKKDGADNPWQKVKVDRQILAVGAVEQVDAIYSDDRGVKKLAERRGIQVFRTEELPLPPEADQIDLFDGDSKD